MRRPSNAAGTFATGCQAFVLQFEFLKALERTTVRYGVDADEQGHRGSAEVVLDFLITDQGIHTGSGRESEQTLAGRRAACSLDDRFEQVDRLRRRRILKMKFAVHAGCRVRHARRRAAVMSWSYGTTLGPLDFRRGGFEKTRMYSWTFLNRKFGGYG